MNGENFFHLAHLQYDLVLASRSVLLEYCQGIAPSDFVAESSGFGHGGSIRNIPVHITNTYQRWIDRIALKADVVYTEYEAIPDISQAVALFNSVDQSMERFIHDVDLISTVVVNDGRTGSQQYVKAFALFTHVITHKFHHKGQILSRSRQLGYTPVDTDVIR